MAGALRGLALGSPFGMVHLITYWYDRLLRGVVGLLEQRRGLRNVLVVVGGALVSAAAARQMIHRPGDHKYLLVALFVIIGLTLVIRWLPAAPGTIVLLTALIPYPVSVVGKTPFGVVSAAGALAFLIVVAAALVADRDRFRLPPEPGIRILLLWTAWSIVSAATSAAPKLALNEARQVLIAMPLAFLAGRFVAARRPDTLRLCLMAVSAIAFLAVVQAITGFNTIRLLPHGAHFPIVDPGESYRYGQVRVRLGYYHGSELGRVLAVALPFMIVESLRRGAAAWLRIGLVLTVAALGLTLTFTDYIAAGVGVAVLVVASPVSRRQAGAAAAVVVFAIAFGAGRSVTALITARLHPTGSNLAEQNLRLALVPAGLHFANHHRLLGSGPGTFQIERLVTVIGGVPTQLVDDSTYVARLIEGGYPGLVLFVIGLVALVVGVWKRRRLPLQPAVLAGLAAWLVAAATVDALVNDGALLATWLLLGVGAGTGLARAGRHPAADDHRSGSSPAAPRSTSAVAAAAAAHR